MNIGLISQRRRLRNAPIGITWEMGINLSRVANPTSDTVPNWNNIRPAQGPIPSTTSFPNLVDLNSMNRGVTFTVSTNGSDSGSWFTAGDIPPNYLHPAPQLYYAAWFLENGVPSTFVISGLDDSKTYSFRFYAADSVNYTAGQVVTRITTGAEIVDIDVANGAPSSDDFNDPVLGAFDDLTSVSGSIAFTASPQGSENFYVLMGIRIREYGAVTPEPSPKSFKAVYNNDPSNTSPFGYYESLPEGYDFSPSGQNEFPLIISFHGSDEAGDGNSVDLPKVLNWGIPKMGSNGTFNENFIALSPQYTIPQAYQADAIRDFIDYAKETYKVDESRIYLTGMSAGGMYSLYYLQQYPTSHGIAAVVPISAPGEEGYTDTALIAASGCPQWWMSNIGDPVAPWEDDGAGYTSILNVVSAITAADPNVVEKLTGFDNSTHDGTWDGIYDSSLIGTADLNYDPFDESIYDWMMEHTADVDLFAARR